jgi:hypothetical protein
MTDDGVDRIVRAQHRREAVAEAGQVRETPGRLAMRRCIDADDREARRAQRRDEVAETRGVRAPPVNQYDGGAWRVPAPDSEFLSTRVQRQPRGLRDHGCVFGIHAATRRRHEQAQREPRGERRAHELHGAEKPAQAPLQPRRHAGYDATEDWLATFFHHSRSGAVGT